MLKALPQERQPLMEIEWWQALLVTMVSINTTINLIVFFRGRKILKKKTND